MCSREHVTGQLVFLIKIKITTERSVKSGPATRHGGTWGEEEV
jgi:hypothetical protein